MSDQTTPSGDKQTQAKTDAAESHNKLRDEALDLSSAAHFVVVGNRAQLTDSEKPKESGTQLLSKANPKDTMQVVVQLKSKASDAALDDMFKQVTEGKHAPLSSSEFEQKFGVDPDGVKQLQKFAKDNGLTMNADNTNTKSGVVVLEGSAGQMEKAFSVHLNNYKADGETFKSYDGKASV
jgi:subtilase family serine protease